MTIMLFHHRLFLVNPPTTLKYLQIKLYQHCWRGKRSMSSWNLVQECMNSLKRSLFGFVVSCMLQATAISFMARKLSLKRNHFRIAIPNTSLNRRQIYFLIINLFSYQLFVNCIKFLVHEAKLCIKLPLFGIKLCIKLLVHSFKKGCRTLAKPVLFCF